MRSNLEHLKQSVFCKYADYIKVRTKNSDLFFDEYKNLKTNEISQLVKDRIATKIMELTKK